MVPCRGRCGRPTFLRRQSHSNGSRQPGHPARTSGAPPQMRRHASGELQHVQQPGAAGHSPFSPFDLVVTVKPAASAMLCPPYTAPAPPPPRTRSARRAHKAPHRTAPHPRPVIYCGRRQRGHCAWSSCSVRRGVQPLRWRTEGFGVVGGAGLLVLVLGSHLRRAAAGRHPSAVGHGGRGRMGRKIQV